MAEIALLAVEPDAVADWAEALRAASAQAGLALDLRTDPADADPAAVRWLIFSPNGPLRDLAPFTALHAALSLWAGVERALALPGLRAGAPLCRMVESGMTEGMRDYVVAHVLRYHMGLDATLAGPGPVWFEPVPPLARWRGVGVLGLGALGGTVAGALAALGFRVAGWSRTPRALDGVDCRHGPEGLAAVLAGAEILVNLLPATPATENLLDAATLALLPRGARLINAGRATTVDDAALLAALATGALAHATLDVLRQEPPPADHPFRNHPGITLTPHVASATRRPTAAAEIVAQIGRHGRGEPLRHVVDRTRGY